MVRLNVRGSPLAAFLHTKLFSFTSSVYIYGGFPPMTNNYYDLSLRYILLSLSLFVLLVLSSFSLLAFSGLYYFLIGFTEH